MGVSDGGFPVGIEQDGYKNRDQYHRALIATISSRIGPRFVDAVQIEFWQVGPHEVITLECHPAVPPVHAYLDGKDLYVREGPTSKRLLDKDLEDWIRDH